MVCACIPYVQYNRNTAKIVRPHLEFGRAPRLFEIMCQQDLPGATDEGVGALDIVGARIVGEAIDAALVVDRSRKRPASIVRRTGVVDHEISRAARIGVIVLRHRDRTIERRGEHLVEPALLQDSAQALAIRQAGTASDPVGELGRQPVAPRAKLSAFQHRRQQARSLLQRIARKALCVGIVNAGAHGLEHGRALRLEFAFPGGEGGRRKQKRSRAGRRSGPPTTKNAARYCASYALPHKGCYPCESLTGTRGGIKRNCLLEEGFRRLDLNCRLALRLDALPDSAARSGPPSVFRARMRSAM